MATALYGTTTYFAEESAEFLDSFWQNCQTSLKFHIVFTLPPLGVRSTVIVVAVCLSVYLLTYLNKCSAVGEMGDRLATIDMGRKVGVHAKFHLDPSKRVTTIDMGQNREVLCPSLIWRGRGPHLTQCRLGRGLPPYQVAS